LCPALCRSAVFRSVGRPCLRIRSRNVRRRALESPACGRGPRGRAPARSRRRSVPACPASARCRAFVVIVQELRQLLAQAFVSRALVPELDGALEQLLLNFLRKLAPESDGSFTQDTYEALGIVVYGHGTLPARDKRGVGSRVPLYRFA